MFQPFWDSVGSHVVAQPYVKHFSVIHVMIAPHDWHIKVRDHKEKLVEEFTGKTRREAQDKFEAAGYVPSGAHN